jgi:hypothetical protein
MYCYESSREAWRRPSPTQGCSTSKEKDTVCIQILFEIFFAGMNTQSDSYEVLFKINVLCYVLLSILNKISIVQRISFKQFTRSVRFCQNIFII